METENAEKEETWKIVFKHVFEKTDEMLADCEKMHIKPAGFNIPLNLQYKGYAVSISLRAIDEKDTTEAD